MQLMGGLRPDALTFGNRYTRNPNDFFTVGNDRQAVPEMTRDVGVDQDVLHSFRRRQAEWPHAVAWLAGANGEGQLYEVAVEVANLITGLEACWVAATGGRNQVMGRRCRLPARAIDGCCERRVVTPGCLGFGKAGLRNQLTDDAPLQRRRQRAECLLIGGDARRQAGDLLIQISILLRQDVGGAGEQLAG